MDMIRQVGMVVKFRMQAKVGSRQEKRRKGGTEIFFVVEGSRGDLIRKEEKREREGRKPVAIYTSDPTSPSLSYKL